jgi:hypothetical protein
VKAARVCLAVFVAILTALLAPWCLIDGNVRAFLAVFFLGSLATAMSWPDGDDSRPGGAA